MALHHLHKRKRIHQFRELYPHPSILKRLVDKLVYVAGFASPIMTVPQAYKIWSEQKAESVAIETWTTYTLVAIVFMVYGIIHKEKPLIFMYSMLFIINSFIVIGILTFR